MEIYHINIDEKLYSLGFYRSEEKCSRPAGYSQLFKIKTLIPETRVPDQGFGITIKIIKVMRNFNAFALTLK